MQPTHSRARSPTRSLSTIVRGTNKRGKYQINLSIFEPMEQREPSSDGAARAEVNLLAFCRVATEFGELKLLGWPSRDKEQAFQAAKPLGTVGQAFQAAKPLGTVVGEVTEHVREARGQGEPGGQVFDSFILRFKNLSP